MVKGGVLLNNVHLHRDPEILNALPDLALVYGPTSFVPVAGPLPYSEYQPRHRGHLPLLPPFGFTRSRPLPAVRTQVLLRLLPTLPTPHLRSFYETCALSGSTPTPFTAPFPLRVSTLHTQYSASHSYDW